MNALVAFEAAARLKNFTRAAAELQVTRVAVSRQIKALEDDLGVKLFYRQHRSVRLTPSGEQLFKSVDKGLNDIADTKRQIRVRQRQSLLNITMTTAFATFWLVPRLGRFRERHPDIELRLTISDRYLDLTEEGIDAAIRFGTGTWKGHAATHLLQEAVFPLCSPEYLNGRTPLSRPADLLGERLLHLDGIYREDAKWPNWFRTRGLAAPDRHNCIYMDAYTNMVQAALEGQGIALCGAPLMNHFLAKGSLVRPIETPPLERDAFYFVKPKTPLKPQEIACLENWIFAEATAMDPSCPAAS